MHPFLYIVTGAPGSGKTTALAALLQRPHPYVAFDIDWLTIPASQLARADIIVDRTTWPAYNAPVRPTSGTEQRLIQPVVGVTPAGLPTRSS